MRIWIINHYAAPVSRAGNTRHHHLALELQKLGHRVLLIGASRHHLAYEGPATGGRPGSEVVDGVEYLWIRTLFRGERQGTRLVNWFFFSLLCRFQAGRKAPFLPDVVIGSSPTPLAALTGLGLARSNAVPFVYEVRDLWPLTLQELGNYSPRHPAIRLLFWLNGYLYQRASLVIALMCEASHYYRRLGFDDRKTVCVPNGVSFEARGKGGTTSLLGSGLHVVYAGNHGLANGLDRILDCANVLTEEGCADRFSFHLIGTGPLKERLRRRAKELGLENVFFHEPVPKSEIFGYLDQADILIAVLEDLSVYQFGMSLNKVYDYLAAGKPVVFAGEVPDNPVAASGGGITVAPAQARGLVDALLRIESLPRAEREHMGRRGKDFVTRTCSYAERARSLDEALSRIVFRPPDPLRRPAAL